MEIIVNKGDVIPEQDLEDKICLIGKITNISSLKTNRENQESNNKEAEFVIIGFKTYCWESDSKIEISERNYKRLSNYYRVDEPDELLGREIIAVYDGIEIGSDILKYPKGIIPFKIN